MNYSEQFKKAQKEGTAKSLVPEFFKWEKPRMWVIGKYVSREQVTSKDTKGTYYQYVFDTDNGLIKCHMGNKFDNEIGEVLVKGMVLRIEYQGKEEIGGGKSVNLFDVKVIPGLEGTQEPAPISDDDIPF